MKKIFIFLISIVLIFANDFENSKDAIQKTNDSLQNMQKDIDVLDFKEDAATNQYLALSIKLENLQNENRHLKQMVKLQDEKLFRIKENINSIDKTRKDIVPLMKNMVDALEKLIQKDAPFLLDIRLQRLDKLKAYMQRADILVSEKFRKILENYEIEYDYSNTISSYQSNLKNSAYTFLRVGKVGFYRESLDKSEYSLWDTKSKKWIEVDSIQGKINIAKGIKIAKKQISPELLTLPFVNAKDIK